MLANSAIKGIGSYALIKTNNELYGVGKSNFEDAIELLLFSYALSNPEYITEEDIKNIDKRIADIKL